MGIFELVSFIASIASLILAIVAIWASRNSEREVRENFNKTQAVMVEYQEKTKEVLAEIDKRAAVIERTVSDSQRQLMTTMTNIINETVLPKKADVGEQLGMQFIQQMFSNPQKADEMMNSLAKIMTLTEASKGERLTK